MTLSEIIYKLYMGGQVCLFLETKFQVRCKIIWFSLFPRTV